MNDLSLGWLWAIGGLVLLCAELIAPGFFLLFIGAAALATGLFTLLFDLGPITSLILFAVYALLAVLAGRRFYARPFTLGGYRHLNDPAARLVGRSAVVSEAIDGSSGRVKLGDGAWSARGGPAAIGETVKIVAVEGNCLIVAPSLPIAAPRDQAA